MQPAGWTREGNGTLDGGVENRVIGYFAYPVDSGTGAPNVRGPPTFLYCRLCTARC